jgi:hypothetical protein
MISLRGIEGTSLMSFRWDSLERVVLMAFEGAFEKKKNIFIYKNIKKNSGVDNFVNTPCADINKIIRKIKFNVQKLKFN